MSPTKKAAKKKLPAKKAAGKAPAKKAAAKKAAVKKPAAKKAAVKKPAAKKTPAKKLSAKKAAAKRPAAKKAAAKKPATKKIPARKPAAKPVAKKKRAPVQAQGGAAVDAYIAAIADPGRRQDCRTLVEVFSKATGRQPKLWGPSIVAFGKYHYKYASGHEGDSCLAGFASRKGALTLYLTQEDADRGALLRKLGKHREGKGCVYLKDLEGVDLEVLGELVKQSAETIRRLHPVEE